MADALISINHTLGTVLYGLDAQVPDEMSSGDTPCVSMVDILQLLDRYAIPHRELQLPWSEPQPWHEAKR